MKPLKISALGQKTYPKITFKIGKSRIMESPITQAFPVGGAFTVFFKLCARRLNKVANKPKNNLRAASKLVAVSEAH